VCIMGIEEKICCYNEEDYLEVIFERKTGSRKTNRREEPLWDLLHNLRGVNDGIR